eukprot:scaffold62201_cov18-Tisochrysis_lutea.AAC.3
MQLTCRPYLRFAAYHHECTVVPSLQQQSNNFAWPATRLACRPYLRFAGYQPSTQHFNVSVLYCLHQSRSRMCATKPVLRICTESDRCAKQTAGTGHLPGTSRIPPCVQDVSSLCCPRNLISTTLRSSYATSAVP